MSVAQGSGGRPARADGPDRPAGPLSEVLRRHGLPDLSVLLAVLATAGGFLLVQHWIDRREPKLAAAALDPRATEAEFGPLPPAGQPS